MGYREREGWRQANRGRDLEGDLEELEARSDT